MAIHRSFHFEVKPEAVAKCRAAIEEFVGEIEGAPGVLYYYAMQDAERETRFLAMVSFTDDAAMKLFDESDAVQRYLTTIYPEVLGHPDLRAWTVVAGFSS